MTKEELLKYLSNNGFSSDGSLGFYVRTDDFENVEKIIKNEPIYAEVKPVVQNYFRLKKLSHSCFHD